MAFVRGLMITLLVIFGYHTNALYKSTVCLPKGEMNSISLTSVYIASINPYITTDKFNSSSSSCTLVSSVPYTAIDLTLHDCFLCDMNSIKNATESDRFYTLSDINDNINSIITEIDSRLEITSLSYITYASANFISPQGRCSQFKYPRICLLDLFNLIGALQGPLITELKTFLFSMQLDRVNKIVSFEMTNNVGNQYWFGVGFSNISMEGDCAVVSTGNGFDPYTIADYFITVTSPRGNGVVKDQQQDYTNVQTLDVNGIYTITFDRAFDTGDPKNFVLDGTEKDISLYAAVGVLGLALGDHNNRFNSVTSRSVRFVPSPADSDTMWCSGVGSNDCLIAVHPQTNDPSNVPTESPTLSDAPTIMPTKGPSQIPSVSPSQSPVPLHPRVGPTAVTQPPTSLGNDSSASSIFRQSLLLFMIVAGVVCMY